MKFTLLIAMLGCFLISCDSSESAQINTGDKAESIEITPVLHSSLVLQADNMVIFIDPYGGTDRYASLPDPDLVLITHVHGDHMDTATLNGLNLANATLVAPPSVIDRLGNTYFASQKSLRNGHTLDWRGIKIEAIPMYNLPEDSTRHVKGEGNGYVLTLAGKRIYISGDTEDIPEMRNLKDIDIAFVCMNLPYTMNVEQAASAVLDFAPGIVYPFHYRGANNQFSDVKRFKELVNKGNPDIEVRLENWYPAL